MAVDAESGRCDVVVLGAGASGLALAYRLAKHGRRVVLLESAERVGGVVTTRSDDGWLLESGPNSFTSFPPAILDLVREVGLGDRVLLQPLRENDRFVWRDGSLRKVPMGPGELFGADILTIGQKLRAAYGLFKSVPPPKDDLTLGAYFRPRVGDAVVDYMLKPFLSGVYAADADNVSFEATFGKLYKPARDNARLFGVLRSLKPKEKHKGPRPAKCLTSFPDGLREFPEALARAFVAAGGTLHTAVSPTLRRGESERWALEWNGGRVETPTVVCATSAPEAARMIGGVCAEGAAILSAIPYAPLTVVHVGLREDQCAEKRRGFGYLTVAGHGVRMLGMIWSDRIFTGRAPSGHRLMTCFYGGERDPEAMTWDDATLRRNLEADLRTVMGFAGGEPALLRITRWERAIPIFRVGHMRRVEALAAALPAGIRTMGNYMGGVSIPDRIVAATALAAELAGASTHEVAAR